MPDAGPITETEISAFRDALDQPVAAEPRPLRQPSPYRPGRGLADRARDRVHAIACWVVVWTTPTDDRARF
jgi:hypothetical protein